MLPMIDSMQHRFVIRPELGMVFLEYFGKISSEALILGQHQVILHPDYRQSFNILADFRQAGLTLNSQEMQFAVDLLARNRDVSQQFSRLALLVKRDVDYGLCRMWSFLADAIYADVAVFRNEKDAFAWVGLDPGFDLRGLFNP